MSFLRAAVLLSLLSSVAACATAPVADAGLRPSVSAGPATVSDLDLDGDWSSAALFMAGSGALSEGKSADAARFFAKAAELAPEEDKAFLSEQAFTASIMGGAIDRAASIAPTDTQASTYLLGRLVVGVDTFARGDAKGAYAVLDNDAVGLVHRNAADLVRPWIALAAGDVTTATAGSVNVGKTPVQAFAALNQAQVLEAAGQPERAMPVYQALNERVEGFDLFILAQGAFLERQGRRREALALYDAHLKTDPDNPQITAARARAASRRSAPDLPTPQQGAGRSLLIAAKSALTQRDPATGVIYLRLALRLDPELTEALVMVGDFMQQSGDAENARVAYGQVPASSPDYATAQLRIIMSYKREDDEEAALQVTRRLAAAQPRNPVAQTLLADGLRGAKDYTGSIEVLSRLIAAEGKNADWSLYYGRAVSLDMAGRWPEAERDLLRAQAIAPDEADVMNYLGYSWADKGLRLPEALALLQKAAAADPNSGAIIDSLGWVYFRMGEYDKAVEQLERAVELAPAAADINDHLGDVYAKLGRDLEARYQWQRVLTLEADDTLKAKAQAKIDAMPAPAPIVAASLVSETAAP